MLSRAHCARVKTSLIAQIEANAKAHLHQLHLAPSVLGPLVGQAITVRRLSEALS